MSHYWAKFKQIGGSTYRFDTRIYLISRQRHPSDNDFCIGAVVGKNPGSARPSIVASGLQKINLDGDKLLPNVLSIFLKAHEQSGKSIEQNSYIQVLNLIYICNKDLKQAISNIGTNHEVCTTENNHFPFLWYVWGGYDAELNPYKNRFLNLDVDKHFYLNNMTEEIIMKAPTVKDLAKHTQGLRHELVVPFISMTLN